MNPPTIHLCIVPSVAITWDGNRGYVEASAFEHSFWITQFQIAEETPTTGFVVKSLRTGVEMLFSWYSTNYFNDKVTSRTYRSSTGIYSIDILND